ncbi:Rho termination factor N-terminal domain-containing protein, partial [Streptomyces sp.]|uniref:Rho termination factor N-terminal domain-containing protein n=1 Tax=Streptomyces sp. TaxID=1931 RepID=UPI002811FF35
MSDTTDLMGVTADNSVDTAAPAAGAASGGTARRRRSGTGLEGMVLAELQQVASGLGIRGTARMRKSQLIEVIKEAQASGPAAKTADAAETKPKRRATSKARTGEAAETGAPQAEKAEPAVAQQQIDIPGQPAADDAPVGERRRRRATAPAGSPEGEAKAEAVQAVRTETRTAEARTETREAKPDTQNADAKAEA